MTRTNSSGSDAQAQAAASWVLYDASCAKCTALAARFRKPLRRRGYITAPLQSLWVPAALQMAPAELLKEMRVFTARGEIYGGADAVVHLAREFWWARPLGWLARLPGVKRALRALYQWIADHRHCTASRCDVQERS